MEDVIVMGLAAPAILVLLIKSGAIALLNREIGWKLFKCRFCMLYWITFALTIFYGESVGFFTFLVHWTASFGLAYFFFGLYNDKECIKLLAVTRDALARAVGHETKYDKDEQV